MSLDIEHLKQWIGRTESRTDFAAADAACRRWPRRSTATTRRAQPATRAAAAGTGCTSCRCTGSPRSAPTAIRSAAASCRRCRCRAACGPAAGIEFHRAAARRAGDRAHARASPTCSVQGRPQRPAGVRARAPRDPRRRRARAHRRARHRLPRQPEAGRSGAAGAAAPDDAQWTRTIVPDDVLLFRYSALTFNGHRIHYDRRYVTEVEGYPGPGRARAADRDAAARPAAARAARRDGAALRVPAVKPLFDIAPFEVCGRRGDDGDDRQLWAQHADGALAMDATATLA